MYTALNILPIEFLVVTTNTDATKYRLVVKKKGIEYIVDTPSNYVVDILYKRITYDYEFKYGTGTYTFELYSNYKDPLTYELVAKDAIIKVDLDTSLSGKKKVYTTSTSMYCSVVGIPKSYRESVTLSNKTNDTIEVGSNREIVTVTLPFGIIVTVVKFNVKVANGVNRVTSEYTDSVLGKVISKVGTIVKIDSTNRLYIKGKV